jgi:hypothetical protein
MNLMHTLGHRKCNSSIEPNSDVENDNLNPNNCHLKRQKKASMSGMCEMQEMMKESESQRGKFEGKIVEALQESTRVYETAQKNFLDVLKDKLN